MTNKEIKDARLSVMLVIAGVWVYTLFIVAFLFMGDV